MDHIPPAPFSMESSMQEYWGRLPFHTPWDLPNPGIEPASLVTPASAGGFFTTSTTWEAPCTWCYVSRYVYICTYVCMCGYIWWCMVEARKKGSFLKPVGYSNCFTNHLVDNGALLLLNSNRRVNNQLRSKRSLFRLIFFFPVTNLCHPISYHVLRDNFLQCGLHKIPCVC